MPLFALLSVIFNLAYAHPPPTSITCHGSLNGSLPAERPFAVFLGRARPRPLRHPIGRKGCAPPAKSRAVLREQCRHPERVRWECGRWRRSGRPFLTKIGTLTVAVARKGEIHVEVVKALRNRVELMLDAPLDVMAASAFPTMPASSTSAAAPVTTTTPRTTSPSMIPHQGCH